MSPNSAFFVPQSQRLNEQHTSLLLLHPAILHPSIAPPTQPAAVLDSATGTGIALRALVDRFPMYETLVGVDLIADEFPLEGERVASNGREIEFEVRDVVQGFGAKHKGKYDLVHQRLLIAALPAESWPAAVANLVEVVKPGGWIQLIEFDPSFVENESTPASYVVANNLMDAAIAGLGKDKKIVDHLEGHLKAAGLVDTSTVRIPSPYGASIPPSLPAEYRRMRHSSILGAHAVVFYRLLGRQPELLPEAIETEASFDEWMTRFACDLDEVGGSQDWGIVAGRKPANA